MADTQIRPSTPPGTIPTPPSVGRASPKGPAVILTPAPEPVTATAMNTDLTGALLADKYRLVRLLGRGGVGEVYEAVHEVIGLRVAVKLIRFEYAGNPELAARFLQEARAAAAVGHPGIVQVHDVGTSHDGRTYLVMEFLEGEDLERRMRRHRRMPVDEIAAILVDVLEALDAAHAKGIVHRDLKPENIFLAAGRKGERNVKLLDFGIARLTANADQSVRLTQPGAVMGTPYYMSPEQARGDQNVDAGVDIYAAGVILFEALTGRLPFVGTSFHQVLVQSLTAPFPSARELRPELPEALEQVIFKATARERAERYARAADFAAALAPFRSARSTAGVVEGELHGNGEHRALTAQTPPPIPAHTTEPPSPPRVTTGQRPPQPRTSPAPAASVPAPETPGKRRGRAAVWITLGALALALVAGVLVLALRRTPAPPAPASVATDGAFAGPVRIRVEGIPADAEVLCDGRPVGPEFELRDGPVERTVEVRAPDRPPVRRVIRATQDLTLDLRAEFAPTTDPPPPAP
ncbi:MAG: serine/threonine protein kinase [Myxococcales bacterium]|nr:serine/threonine protein kinase [Myxococcales bacterium]